MKTGQAAKALGVDNKTIVNWIDRPELNKFFSPGARGENGRSQRDINPNDLLLLNTIRGIRSTMPQNATDWRAIADALERGELNDVLPPSAATVETGITDLDRWKYAIVLEQERNDAIARKEDAERRLAELEQRLAAIEAERRQDQEKLLREIADLRADLAKNQALLELWESGRLKPKE